MPTQTYNRIWCKTCEEFELHSQPINGEFTCHLCETVYSDIKLKDIPKDKLIEQRKRYSKAESEKNLKFYNSFLKGGYGGMGGNPLDDLFRDDWPNAEIQESDAGQRLIDEKKLEKERIERERQREQRLKDLELAAKYAKLNRNDICICGSLKKYKKCCLNKINRK